MKRLGALLLLAAVFVMMVGGGAAQAATCSGYPCPDVDIEIDGNPKPGDVVPVGGFNWCPNSTVSIYLDGVFQGTATTNPSGTFVFDLELSKTIATGNHTVEVVGLDASCSTLRTVTTIITIAGGQAGEGRNALPFTGSNISVGLLLLVALVVVGGIALVAGRRREHPVIEE